MIGKGEIEKAEYKLKRMITDACDNAKEGRGDRKKQGVLAE